MKFLSAFLLFSFLVFSCGDTADTMDDMDDTETTMTAPEMETPPAPPQPDPMLPATVDAVQSAGGDITALPASAAVSNIDGWIGKLSSMDGTDAIVSDLQMLKTELTASSIDGGKVSNILSSLADKTRSMSSKAPALGTLASALQAGADKLSGK